MTEEYLSKQLDAQNARRKFLQTTAACMCGAIATVALGSLITSCETDESTGVGPITPVTLDMSKVAGLDEDGATVLVDIPQLNAALPTFIHRVNATQYNAFVSKCTHEGFVVRAPADITSNCVCSGHFAEFSRVDGKNISPPISGGSASDLPKYTTTYDAVTRILTISA